MSVYRYSVWFVKGLREYTKTGFIAAQKSFKPDALDADISQRSFMITGANSGVGKATAIALAKKGAFVHMVCRDQGRGEQARDEIVEISGNSKVELHILDMSQPSTVRKFAREFVSSERPLHVLVNNAGCMVNQRELTTDELEKNFATNTLGTYILTKELIPCLSRNESPRVITVSSGGMLLVKLDHTDLQSQNMSKFDGALVYAQNKRQQVVMTERLADKYPNIYFASMHPGWADTPAVRTSMPDFYNRTKHVLRSAEQGADTIIWLCITPNVSQHPNGSFFQDRNPVPKHLPLAWTKSSLEEENELMLALDEMSNKFE
ncbi:dehydrogenase/reductase SDR family member 12-like [Actinia tenebrosa]|uniref:Dehydrogenase/reductase SDR family member 12-like n=1 Tax=Actinia tenebrosa TaxID=6105 RepID=A0A6P8HY42_ACTTE|nr:dehydrogenase/reductase SDR family member 12-like [Actinia tenebrosa]